MAAPTKVEAQEYVDAARLYVEAYQQVENCRAASEAADIALTDAAARLALAATADGLSAFTIA